MRLLTSTLYDDPRENLKTIGRGEFRKAQSEEPWYWPERFCLAAPSTGPEVCHFHLGHSGKHSWEPGAHLYRYY